MKKEASAILKLADKAFSNRDQNRSLFEDCYELLSPFKNTFTKHGGTLNKHSRQYSSVGQISAQNFITTMVNNFIPPYTKWMELQTGDLVPKDQRQTINEVLQEVNNTFFAYLDSSNFTTAASEMFFDWGIGTGAMMMLDGGSNTRPFNFVSVPMSQLGILEGKYGEISFKCREYPLAGELINVCWPTAKISDKLQKSINGKKDKDFTIVESFYYDEEELVWVHSVIVREAKEEIFTMKTLDELFITPRWMRIPGFAHGVGPFLMALADIKTDNAFQEFSLRSAALDVAGVYTVAGNGVLNTNNIKVAPNTFIPVERNGGENGPSIQRLDTGGNYQLQEFMSQKLADQIKRTMLDNKLPAETPQPKTAFEIAERIKDYQVDIGAAYPRGMQEFASLVYKRGLSLLAQRKLVNLPEGFTIDNLFIKVQIVSPISQLQRYDELQRTMQAFAMAQSVSPELAMMSYKVEDMPQYINEKSSGDAKLIRPKAETEVLTEKVAQIVAQMQMQQQQGAQ